MAIEFLDLGSQPLANAFVTDVKKKEFRYDLKVQYDEDTHLVSLVEQPKKGLMFNDSYVYHSSGSRTMRDHFYEAALMIMKEWDPRHILEIGSNDGVFIQNFNAIFAECVEPCGNFAEHTQKMGYKTHAEFWDMDMADNLAERPDVIYSANCMCHIPDLQEAFNAVYHALQGGGIFVFEDPAITDILERNSYDQIYDEHAHLFSVTALRKMLWEAGLQLFDVQKLSVHGGSKRIFAKKSTTGIDLTQRAEYHLAYEKSLGIMDVETYHQFARNVAQSKEDLTNLLKDELADKKVICYGATSKSTTVFNHCDITSSEIEYIVDTTPDKQGKWSPGVNIPVISPEDGMNDTVDYAFLGAWNFVGEIKKNEAEFMERGGKFITHVPVVHVL